MDLGLLIFFFFFPVMVLSDFGIKRLLASFNEVWSVPYSYFFVRLRLVYCFWGMSRFCIKAEYNLVSKSGLLDSVVGKYMRHSFSLANIYTFYSITSMNYWIIGLTKLCLLTIDPFSNFSGIKFKGSMELRGKENCSITKIKCFSCQHD